MANSNWVYADRMERADRMSWVYRIARSQVDTLMTIKIPSHGGRTVSCEAYMSSVSMCQTSGGRLLLADFIVPCFPGMVLLCEGTEALASVLGFGDVDLTHNELAKCWRPASSGAVC